ncbi:hypothetical protein VNO77_20871 [Canavalia gladiata]|uniref:Tyrosinase copper-binding domain-containing protein n=1 Tax=Canavalia gladiata TaxID=3824 RepID=A0AAN9QJR5_CANGL
MRTPNSCLLPLLLFFVLIVLFLIPLISLLNNDFSIFTIQTFSYLVSLYGHANHHSSNFSIPYDEDKSLFWRKGFIGFKDIDEPSSPYSISRAINPNVSMCFLVDLPPNALTSTHCCPSLPFPSKIKDFKDFASPNATLRIRKPVHLVDQEFIAKFEKGIALMKALPAHDPRNFDQQSRVHCAYCNGAYHQPHPFEGLKLDIHRSWLFFPFHRWYIFFFERILGNLIGDPNFALPFWNWDSLEGMQIPLYFSNPNSSLYHKLRDPKHMPPHVVDLAFNGKDNSVPYHQQVSYNLATMYKQMVLANTKELFMGMPLRVGDKPQPGPGSIESAPHNTVHSWTGDGHAPNREDMGSFYSAARDPIFYPHHSNLDRMWVLWKTLDEGRKEYSDPDWLNSGFVFYDENANPVRVKIKDCIETKNLGYVYEDVDIPWLHYPPTSHRTKLLREAKKAEILGSKPTKFPLVLDSIVSTVVKRPKKMRRKEEKEQEEEVLVIEGIEFGSDKYVTFDVHIDDDEDKLSVPDQTEFVGSFVSVSHGHRRQINTRFMVGISKVLENLESEGDDYVLVTLVPKSREGEVIIGNIKIELIPKY